MVRGGGRARARINRVHGADQSRGSEDPLIPRDRWSSWSSRNHELGDRDHAGDLELWAVL